MANVPQPQSYEQILSDMLSAYAAKMGINDFNVGSAVTSFFEVVALMVARASGDVFQVLRDFSVDRATGDALKRLATENNVPLVTAQVATGFTNVIDTTFTKISTKIYAGANPPNIGSTSINVSDASSFPSSGAIYLGRGTPNIEGPISYSSITPTGGYFVINLSSPTTKFHNLGETVILSQGGIRSVPSGTIVISPSTGANADLQYSVSANAIILDGEIEVDNVPITALTPGASGNVPIGAIKQFSNAPFSGATVTNALPITTGTDNETDDQLRVRIKRAQASTGLGTVTAVESAVIGATPSDEQETVVSDNMIIDASGNATLVVDNGNGYEEKSSGVGLESIVDSALGGEEFFQLATGGRQTQIAKAFLQSTLAAPFDIRGGDTLAVVVGGVTYQHVFADTDFVSPGGATAYEIASSINADTALGFEASTAGAGSYVLIRAESDQNDTIQVTTPTTSGRDAAVLIGFPSNEVQTLRLYKNDVPLSKDGQTASLFTQSQELWSSSITTGDTLKLSADSTATITYTITDADFIATGLYTSVANTNSLDSWVQVLNAKLTGVTVSVVGTQLEITSNLNASNRAALTIDPTSTLVTKGMFGLTGLSAQGKASDFTLSRPTGQIELVTPLVAGDKLSAGSSTAQAKLESGQISGGSITFSSDAHVWFLVDNPGTLIATGVTSNSLFSVSTPSSNVVRYTSTISSAFANVMVGDYVIIWTNDIPSVDRIEGRVAAITNTTLDIVVTPAEWSAIVPVSGALFTQGLSVLRSTLAPQKFKIAAGTLSLDQIAAALNAQTKSLTFSVLQEQYLVVSSNTRDSNGRVMVVAADLQGILLTFTVGQSSESQTSLTAFYDSTEKRADMPLFIHSAFGAGVSANPIDSYITSVNSGTSLAGRDPNELISVLNPYGSVKDAQPYGESVQETSISGTTVGVAQNPLVRRLRSIDRYFLASPLDFGSQDTITAILDTDIENKSFTIPFFRRAIANTTISNNPNNFNAYDVDSGSSAAFSSAFGTGFNFSNYKALMKAKKVLKPSPSQTALLYRSTKWGRSGEKILVGYVYPSVPNSPIGSTVVIDENVTILINLQSGAAVPSSIDGSTEWNVSVTANTPSAGIDQVTYTWNGTGTNPALALSGGEYVNIGSQTELSAANTGIYRVSTQAGFTPTSTSFSVQRPTGLAVAETNKATQVAGSITFAAASATTAAAVNTYVNANLSSYVSSTIVNDGGSSGTGVIVLSTYEDSAFSFKTVQLKDGLNWLASSNLGGSPNFTFKVPLQLSSDVGYAFNNGEEIRLIPTTMDQVAALISVLAVSGFTTAGSVGLVERASRLELSTDVLGSSGAIQIIGGIANQYEVPVLDTAIRIDNFVAGISVDQVASQGVHSDQWFRLQATAQQNKLTLLSSNTDVTIKPNTPTSGEATVSLIGRQLNQRYFGRPRHHIRPIGNTFRVEKQGNLICISWNGVGTSPHFLKSSLNFNDTGGGTINASMLPGTNTLQIQILTGNANFTTLSINDLITIAGLPVASNNGTFLVTGVSDDGKTLQVLNPIGRNEFSSGTFTFTANANSGDSFQVGGFTLIAGTNFPIGVSQGATAINLSAAIGVLAGFTSSVSGSVVTVTATQVQVTPVPISYTPATSTNVTVSGANLSGPSFVAGNFSASSQVSEGDQVVLSSPFAVLNQGKFRVIRRFNDSIWIENPNAIEEEVALPTNVISLGYDSSTSFKVNATNNTAYVNWNGIGTEPHLENAQMGDLVTFGTDFNSANQGTFMVRKAGIKLQQITQLTMPTGAQYTVGGTGKYFKINSAGNVNQYYVWFDVNSSNSDPAPGGLTGLQVNILSSDTAIQVATKTAAVIAGATGLGASAANGVVTVTTTDYIETNDPVNVNVPAPFVIQVNQEGRRTFLECINSSAVSQSAVFVNNILTCNRPQIQFFEYDATTAGDVFAITGSVLGSTNAGNYTIAKVIDQDTAIIIGSLAPVTGASLNGNETSVFVVEETPYTAYKQVLLIAAQPGSASRNTIVFTTNAQFEKIDSAASVELVSLNKMDFSTVIKIGLDSYRYNTGLIGEANRIIYGDPRDSVTYPGVGAAGAVIFVRSPLSRRVQVSIAIRLNTGVPFVTSAQQVRTSVSSLIKSNPVGQPIAISAIVASVNSISGVRAVSIASPLYSTANDLIFIAPSEKAIIVDPSLDISVSQIGS